MSMETKVLHTVISIDTLPRNIAYSIREFQKANRSAEQGDEISGTNAITYWLQWEGIMGYEAQITNLVVTTLEQCVLASEKTRPVLRLSHG